MHSAAAAIAIEPVLPARAIAATHADFAPTLIDHLSLMRMAYGGLDGVNLLRAALTGGLAGRMALVSSFGADSAVLAHMVAEIAPRTAVIFLDTGMHFAQTRGYAEDLARKLGLADLRIETPDAAALARSDPDNMLWRRDPDACCALRKVAPLAKALEGFDGWITGRRRRQSASRQALQTIEADGKHIKLNPLVHWSLAKIDSYYSRHGLPRHPLHEDGYLSIGCHPCTTRPPTGGHARAGRWAESDKTECGIHVPGFDPVI